MELRKEYNDFIKNKNIITEEAALNWLKENVIIINEKIDPKTINLLNNKIIKFDATFGKFKEKVPALSSILEKAEMEMQQYLTGKLSDKSATDLLEKLGYLYNNISTFLNVTLKSLLKTPMFKIAKENSDVKINVLDKPGHNPENIRDSFMFALKPSNEEMVLLKKLYRGKNIPLMDIKLIATQLLNLSLNELEELSGVEKVPMISVEKSSKEPILEPTTEVPLEESVNEEIELLQEVDMDLLNRVKSYNKALNILKNIPNVNDMPNLKKSIDDLDVKINKVLTSKTNTGIDKIKSIWGGDMDSQLSKLTQYLKSFVDVWDTIKEKYNLQINDNETPLATLQDKTISSMVTNLLKDKNLSKDFLNQTPFELENFSNSLKQYFDVMKNVKPGTSSNSETTTTQTSSETAPEGSEKAESTKDTGESGQAQKAPIEASGSSVDLDQLASMLNITDKTKLDVFIKKLDKAGLSINRKNTKIIV